MMEIELTGGRFACFDNEDLKKISRFKWRAKRSGITYYAQSQSKGIKPKKSVFMHRIVMGLKAKDGKKVDHINGDGLDNRKKNLRICTDSQNFANASISRRNTSGFKGVSFSKKDKKWQAKICKDYKIYWLGLFALPELAAKAYNKKAIDLFGEYAKLNEITRRIDKLQDKA